MITVIAVVCSALLVVFAQALILSADKVSSPGTTLGVGFTWLACAALTETAGWSQWIWAAGAALVVASMAIGAIIRRVFANNDHNNTL